MKPLRIGKLTPILIAGLSSFLTQASPPTDDCVSAVGCFATRTGANAQINVQAVFDVDTHSSAGSLITFADAEAGINISSSVLTDYADPSTSARNLQFRLDSTFADEARVILVDNGSTGDRVEVQLLLNGNLVYHEGGTLLEACSGGGVVVSQNCQPPPVPPCVVGISVSFQYLDCKTIRVDPPKPPKCEPSKPDHCRKHCASSKHCKKHKNNKDDTDCQRVATGGKTYREVCEVKLTYTIKNNGPVPITSLSATDAFGPMDLSSLALPLAPGASLSFEVVEEVSGAVRNVVSVTANQNGDSCAASTEILIEKSAPQPCKPPQGFCNWEYWKTHPECWPVQTITYCGKTYSISDIIAALEKLSKYDWFKSACEKWLTDHLNACKRD